MLTMLIQKKNPQINIILVFKAPVKEASLGGRPAAWAAIFLYPASLSHLSTALTPVQLLQGANKMILLGLAELNCNDFSSVLNDRWIMLSA